MHPRAPCITIRIKLCALFLLFPRPIAYGIVDIIMDNRPGTGLIRGRLRRRKDFVSYPISLFAFYCIRPLVQFFPSPIFLNGTAVCNFLSSPSSPSSSLLRVSHHQFSHCLLPSHHFIDFPASPISQDFTLSPTS